MASPHKTLAGVPVRGGSLCVATWPGAGDPVLAVHGISASHMAFERLTDHLAGTFELLAPDLRGRGGSVGLPEPYGVAAHAADLLAVVEQRGAERPLIVGHSLGAYIAVEFAARYPERTAGLVLIDGGIGLPAPVGVDPEQFLTQVLGPALARLDQVFPNREAYRAFWRRHPAFTEDWSAYLERYLDYDLGGAPPALKPRVSRAAVLADGRCPIAPEMQTRIDDVPVPMLLVRAPRGLLNEPTPLLPEPLVAATAARVPHLEVATIEDCNHYTVLMGRAVAKLAPLILAFRRRVAPDTT